MCANACCPCQGTRVGKREGCFCFVMLLRASPHKTSRSFGWTHLLHDACNARRKDSMGHDSASVLIEHEIQRSLRGVNEDSNQGQSKPVGFPVFHRNVSTQHQEA